MVDPVGIQDLPTYDAILISQSYSDHCHPETLRALDQEVPILATPKAYRRLAKEKLKNPLILLGSLGSAESSLGGLDISFLDPEKRLDPVYYGIVISKGETCIVYAAHGFEPSPSQLAELGHLHCEVLLTTLTEFVLPGFMGGRVNPGIEAAQDLVNQINPKYVLNTHDEPKKAAGLVSRLAKVKYADLETDYFEGRYVATNHYQMVELGG